MILSVSKPLKSKQEKISWYYNAKCGRALFWPSVFRSDRRRFKTWSVSSCCFLTQKTTISPTMSKKMSYSVITALWQFKLHSILSRKEEKSKERESNIISHCFKLQKLRCVLQLAKRVLYTSRCADQYTVPYYIASLAV